MAHTVQINFTGGIVSPGHLKNVLEVAAEAKVSHVRFGLRQQLLFDVPPKNIDLFATACLAKNISYQLKNDAAPNITSSYPAAGIFTADTWLREGVYKDIFNSFTYQPKLKINISDCTQSLVPFFTGHINWISSSSAHFWHLYIRFPTTQKVYSYPELIYTNDVPLVSAHVEQLLLNCDEHVTDSESLYKQMKTAGYVSKVPDQELTLPKFSLPYYEGFNRYDNNYWLGIYRRDELFAVPFLIDVCTLCMETKIGQLYTTPWKSIIIKGIEPDDRNKWDYVLGKYRINVRHAANELNWQVEDNNEDGLMLKRLLIRHFDKEDVRTYGLCFAVKMKPHSGMFGSIVVNRQEGKNPGKLKALQRFEILYTNDFNPNSFQYKSFRKDVEKEHLATYLVSLCKLFYEQGSKRNALLPASKAGEETTNEGAKQSEKVVYQCSCCYTVYDDVVSENNSEPVPFDDLPADYQCPLCEAGIEEFVTIEEVKLFAL
jgi:rubredoxin